MSSLPSAFLVPAVIMTLFVPVAALAQGGGYDAEATCSVTGAHGTGHGGSSGEAINAAIASCSASGGVRA